MAREKANPERWVSGGGGRAVASANPKPSMSVLHMPMTDERIAKFLEKYSRTGSFIKAVNLTDHGLDTRKVWQRLMVRDPAFKSACEKIDKEWEDKVADVLKEEFFEGVKVPVVNKNGIVIDPETKKPIWIRKRDPKIVLAYAKKFDFGLREIKTTVHVDGSPAQADSNDPAFVVKSSDLWRLNQQDMETLTRLLKQVHANRQEAMAEVTMRPDYLDSEDVPYTDITPDNRETHPNDEDNPYDI